MSQVIYFISFLVLLQLIAKTIKPKIKQCLDVKGNALINRQEGGVVYIGVDNSGHVEGISLIDLNQEQFIKDAVSCFLGRFDPPALSENYKTTLIPVTGSPQSNTVVIEIILIPPLSTPVMFQNTTGNVYVKETGSIKGPIRLSEVQKLLRSRIEATVASQVNSINCNVDSYVSSIYNDDDQTATCCGCYPNRKKKSDFSFNEQNYHLGTRYSSTADSEDESEYESETQRETSEQGEISKDASLA